MRSWQRILLKVAYWLAVLIVSVVLLVALILLIESRDKSNVGQGAGAVPAVVVASASSAGPS